MTSTGTIPEESKILTKAKNLISTEPEISTGSQNESGEDEGLANKVKKIIPPKSDESTNVIDLQVQSTKNAHSIYPVTLDVQSSSANEAVENQPDGKMRQQSLESEAAAKQSLELEAAAEKSLELDAAAKDSLLLESRANEAFPYNEQSAIEIRPRLNSFSSAQLLAEHRKAEALEKKLLELSRQRQQLEMQLERERHTVEVLENELESLPEYIELYHRERKALLDKFKEKDQNIRDLLMINSQLKQQLSDCHKIIRNFTGSDQEAMHSLNGAFSNLQHVEYSEPPFIAGFDYSCICPFCTGVLIEI